MKTHSLLTLATLLVFAVGCEVPELDIPESSAEPVATQKSVAESGASEVREGFLPDGRIDMSGVEGEPPMTTSTPREVTAKDPKHGKLSRQAGPLGTIVKTIPWAKNKIIFDMIKYNMRIYDAEKGHYPKSHEEFMEKYLPQYYPAALPLPELEAGDEYLYDPEDHTLKIHRPEQ